MHRDNSCPIDADPDGVNVKSCSNALVAAFGPRLRAGVPLAPFTTFRIGGPAEWLLQVCSADELARAVSLARACGMPWFVLGQGANILVADQGVSGLVIRNKAARMALEGDEIRAESGVAVYPDLIEYAVGARLSGLEHYVGIPSTVGGALWQNLHFLSPDRHRTVFIEEVLAEAEVLTEGGERRSVHPAYFRFGYDYSILHERDDVVLSARFRLVSAPEGELRRTIKSNLRWRGERHPPLDSEPSAGSIFQKVHGMGAGRLIDECGLKGLRVGDAEVSRRHANIIVNLGRATAADVRALIARVQAAVLERKGVWLKPEIRFVGDFADAGV